MILHTGTSVQRNLRSWPRFVCTVTIVVARAPRVCVAGMRLPSFPLHRLVVDELREGRIPRVLQKVCEPPTAADGGY